MSATEHTAHGDKRGAEPTDAAATTSSTPVDLAQAVLDLTDRIEALQDDIRRLGGPGLPPAEPGWNDDGPSQDRVHSHAWLSSIGPPLRRRPVVPRLLLEVLFIAAAAAAAALADLDAVVIAAVMAGSWVLVALIEWAASRADVRRDAFGSVPTVVVSAEPPRADPAWFVPPVEQTLLEPPADSPTAVTKLPPADPEVTEERPPPI